MPFALGVLDFYFVFTFFTFVYLTCGKGDYLDETKFVRKCNAMVFKKMIRRYYTWLHYLFVIKVCIFIISKVIPDGEGSVRCSRNQYSVIVLNESGTIFITAYISSIVCVIVAIKQVFWDCAFSRPHDSKLKSTCARFVWQGNDQNCYFLKE
jgi:hypothetical protein